MRNSVDGKAGEGGAGLGAIGRDHLSKFGHEFGRDHQLQLPSRAFRACRGRLQQKPAVG
jgi:hypothetical protein